VLVTIPESSEQARLRALAEQLGLGDPFDGDHLRLEGAACVFQDEAGSCRLHAHFGPASKPSSCLQFPHVWVDTEHGPRSGVDPCCYRAPMWPVAAPPRDEPARRVRLEPEDSEREREILEALTRDDASVAGMLGWLRDGVLGPREGLPPGLAQRWVADLRGAGLERFLAPSIAGPVLRSALGPSLGLIASLQPWQPPAWPGLEASTERRLLAATHALLRLRICSTALPRVDDAAGLALRGIVLLAWSDPRPDALATGLAGWFRLMRAPQFSRALLS